MVVDRFKFLLELDRRVRIHRENYAEISFTLEDKSGIDYWLLDFWKRLDCKPFLIFASDEILLLESPVYSKFIREAIKEIQRHEYKPMQL